METELSINDTYYGPDAYNSRKESAYHEIDNSTFSFTTRQVRSDPLPRFFETQCCEFLAADAPYVVEELNATDEVTKKLLKSPGHEMHSWQSLSNPRGLVDAAAKAFLFFMVIGWLGVLVMLPVFAFARPDLFVEPKFFIGVLSPSLIMTALHYICRLSIRYSLVKDKNNFYLNRRNGVVIVPQKKKPPKEIPFKEFDAYLGTSVNPSGRTSYHLWLCHRYSELRVTCPTDADRPWEINLEWEFWQQYMDTSKPLPDTPRMEPFRSRDPVTVAYDKENKRPTGYWKNMDLLKAQQLWDSAVKAGSEYPWGLPREEALDMGWRPSGVGEGDWPRNLES